MNNNAWFKKENPFQTVIGYGGGATGFSAYSSSSKTYLDEVFSTHLYKGNNSSNTLTTNLDMSGKGGLTWIKARDSARQYILFDTARGANKKLAVDSNTAEFDGTGAYNQTFTSTGFTLNNSYTDTNDTNVNYSSWNFRKAKGFFDVVTFTTGTSTNRRISHSLGCVPGMIIMKNRGEAEDWIAYHHSLGRDKYFRFNTNQAVNTSSDIWGSSDPTSSDFGFNENAWSPNGKDFVAYVFAGGDTSPGTSANIDITSKTVTNLGGTFDSTHTMAKMTDGILETSNAQNIAYVNAAANPSNPDMDVYVDLDTPHVVTKYRIGPQGGNGTSGYNLVNNFNVYGTNDTSSWDFVASFAPGQSGWTGGAYRDFEWGGGKSYRYWRIQVTQGDSGNNKSISEWKIEGYSTAVDTSSYVFGEDGDKNIISCGSYVGNGGTDDGPEINCGWEPQLILIKKSSDAENWMFLDTIRGLPVDSGAAYLNTNDSDAENTSGSAMVNVSARGFRVVSTDSALNSSGADYVYMAIRRPDPYVTTPAEAGTDVFAMSAPTSGNTPEFASTFPVDWGIYRKPASTQSWFNSTRLLQPYEGKLDSDDAPTSWAAGISFDFMDGWGEPGAYGSGNDYQSWMWKRCQGHDNLIYNVTGGVAGTYGVGQQTIQHNLGRAPEMIWQKYIGTQNSGDDSWIVYHKNLTSNYWLRVDSSNAESDGGSGYWGTSAPTATTFDIKAGSRYVGNHVFLLFASVEGISKVGYYDGSNSEQTITTGFQPRFLIIKRIDAGYAWFVLDTTRGWGSGSDSQLSLNTSDAALSHDFGAPTATGFTLTSFDSYNISGGKFIYYAHA